MTSQHNRSMINQAEGAPISSSSSFLLLDCCFSFVCADCFKKHKSCPTCQEPFSSIHFINCSDNHMLSAILKGYSQMAQSERNAQDDLTCQRCNINESAYHCLKCEAFLCEACNSNVHSMGTFIKHQYRSVESRAQRLESDGLGYLRELEYCETHSGERADYFSASLNKYGCQTCFSQTQPQTFSKIQIINQQYSQRKIDSERDLQTSLSYLSTLIERNNSIQQQELGLQKRSEVALISETIETLISCLKAKQKQLIESLTKEYVLKLEQSSQATQKLTQTKFLVERNYALLKAIMNSVPQAVLQVEDQLIKKIQQTNLALLDRVQKSHGSNKKHNTSFSRLNDDLVQRVEEAIRELITIQEDQVQYKSPQREENRLQ